MTKPRAVKLHHDVLAGELYVVADGLKIAKRGKPGTPRAKNWVSIVPGWSVVSDADLKYIDVSYNPQALTASALNTPALTALDLVDPNTPLAELLYSPVGDPELVKKMGEAFDAYLANLPPGDKRPPHNTTATTHRVKKADGVPSHLGALVIMVWRKKRKKLWGLYRYVDGKILRGSGVADEDFVRMRN